MLKPIDKGVEIKNIRLESKKGGKSDNKEKYDHLSAAIIVCSDSVSKGLADDKSGVMAKTKLEKPVSYTHLDVYKRQVLYRQAISYPMAF